MCIRDRRIRCAVADFFFPEDYGGSGNLYGSRHCAVNSTVAAELRKFSPVPGVKDQGGAGGPGLLAQNRAPNVRGVLRPGVAGQRAPLRYIRLVTGDGPVTQAGIFVHRGGPGGDGVAENPGDVALLLGEVAFRLHKTAQIPGPHLNADVSQGADAVEKGIFFVGDIGDLKFFTARLHQLLCKNCALGQPQTVLFLW